MGRKVRSVPAPGRTVSITEWDYRSLLDAAESLHGEDAVAEVFLLTECPDDPYSQDSAVRSVLRFYTDVRYLLETIRSIRDKAENKRGRKRNTEK